MTMTNQIVHATVLALVWLTVAQPAHAYLDPGTGSMIISAIVGLLVTASLAIKTFYYRIKSFFRGDKNSNPVADKQVPPETEESIDS